MNTNWPPITAQLNGFVAALQQTLAAKLLAVYLHGSLAMGGFNPERSDIDLLVVVEPLTQLERRELGELVLAHSNQPRPLEISFVTPAGLADTTYPLPLEFHFSEDWRPRFVAELADGRWQDWFVETLRDGDLAGQIVMTRAAGIILAGPPPAELLPDIPPHVLRDSFVSDCRWALELRDEIPVYAVLNPCRTYAYLRRGLLLSKAETGRIALELFPAEFHPLIRQASEIYAGTRPAATPFDPDLFTAFAAYLAAELNF